MIFTAIAAGVSLLGAGVSAFGQHQAGQDAEAAAKRNARLARLAAADAVQRGAMEAGRTRMQGTQTIGAQKTAMAASGVDVSSGSPLALMADTRMLSEMDARMIENNAAREAWGLRTGASEMVRQGKAAAQAGTLGAAGTLLGGAADFGAMGTKAGWFGSTPGGK